MYKNILVTTDGSEFAERGLVHAFKLAHTVGAKVTVLTVTAPIPFPGFQAAGPTALHLLSASSRNGTNTLINPRSRSRTGG